MAELDIDVFLHEEVGPASGWAASARRGDPVARWGPRIVYDPPAGTSTQLLLADEAGVPAVASILESLKQGTVVRALIEVGDATDEQPLATEGDVEVTWLHRNGREAGDASLLLDAVRCIEIPDGAYVWGGGEIRAMNQIRRYLRAESGVPARMTALVGYWRHRDHSWDEEQE